MGGFRPRATAAAVALAVVLAGCGSSGGGSGVSQSQLESKLKKDPNLAALETQLHGDKTKIDKVTSCIAKAMQKYIDSSDVKDYVNGKKNLTDLGGKSKGSTQKATDYVKSCVANSLGG